MLILAKFIEKTVFFEKLVTYFNVSIFLMFCQYLYVNLCILF